MVDGGGRRPEVAEEEDKLQIWTMRTLHFVQATKNIKHLGIFVIFIHIILQNISGGFLIGIFKR